MDVIKIFHKFIGQNDRCASSMYYDIMISKMMHVMDMKLLIELKNIIVVLLFMISRYDIIDFVIYDMRRVYDIYDTYILCKYKYILLRKVEKVC